MHRFINIIVQSHELLHCLEKSTATND